MLKNEDCYFSEDGWEAAAKDERWDCPGSSESENLEQGSTCHPSKASSRQFSRYASSNENFRGSGEKLNIEGHNCHGTSQGLSLTSQQQNLLGPQLASQNDILRCLNFNDRSCQISGSGARMRSISTDTFFHETLKENFVYSPMATPIAAVGGGARVCSHEGHLGREAYVLSRGGAGDQHRFQARSAEAAWRPRVY